MILKDCKAQVTSDVLCVTVVCVNRVVADRTLNVHFHTWHSRHWCTSSVISALHLSGSIIKQSSHLQTPSVVHHCTQLMVLDLLRYWHVIAVIIAIIPHLVSKMKFPDVLRLCLALFPEPYDVQLLVLCNF